MTTKIQQSIQPIHPKVIIGLGNPGPKFTFTRHNIGFRILDELAKVYNASWKTKSSQQKMETATITINNFPVLLIKPQTFMNHSGEIVSYLKKQNVSPEETLVIHDELEKPFGNISFRLGGSAKGHNGLKSIISYFGDNFWRLRFGIGRPELKEDVANYVLQSFDKPQEVNILTDQAVNKIQELY